MSSRGRSRATSLGLLVTAVLLGCARPGALPVLSAADSPELQRTPSPAPSPNLQAADGAAAPATALPHPTRSPTEASVQIHARGNLFIRRGPDLAFNSIAVLPKGAVAVATARDVLADWVMIPVPGNAQQSGWVSIMSSFTEIVGDVQVLPQMEPTEWPQLAFLRNCTFHELSANPGGIALPAVQNFPDNDVRVNPGMYSVVDVEVDGYPEVLAVEIREGSAVDILVDGNGEKKKCPVP